MYSRSRLSGTWAQAPCWATVGGPPVKIAQSYTVQADIQISGKPNTSVLINLIVFMAYPLGYVHLNLVKIKVSLKHYNNSNTTRLWKLHLSEDCGVCFMRYSYFGCRRLDTDIHMHASICLDRSAEDLDRVHMQLLIYLWIFSVHNPLSELGLSEQ